MERGECNLIGYNYHIFNFSTYTGTTTTIEIITSRYLISVILVGTNNNFYSADILVFFFFKSVLIKINPETAIKILLLLIASVTLRLIIS